MHPELVDDPERALRIVEPREDLVLVLEAGPRASVRIAPWPSRLMTWRQPVTVLLFAGAIDGEPVSRHRAVVQKPELRFGGFEPGRYTVWVDAGGSTWAGSDNIAPFVLDDVVLGEGETEVGPVAVGRGGQVKVDLRLDDPASLRRVRVWATHQGKPRYGRSCFSYGRGGRPIVLNGLGRGTFELHVDVDQGTFRRKQMVTSDGDGEIELTFDLRTR